MEHGWGEWDYRANGACDLVRACGRCAQAETAVKHVLGRAPLPVFERLRAGGGVQPVAASRTTAPSCIVSTIGAIDKRTIAHRSKPAHGAGQPGRTARVQHDLA